MSKYSIAKDLIAKATVEGKQESLDATDILEALLVQGIADLKEATSSDYARGFLQYEIESLGSGGIYEVQKR
ncbi:MAG: hypothetical protein GXP16_08415 [Gammaproteobacteria bacterium]|nr:hypothetical protein [Gammaproteobacteria bacterium]